MLFFLAYIFIGIIAGTLSGLIGVGGGLIVVPALLFIYKMQGMPADILMHLAAGTSLAAMLISTLTAIIAHARYRVQIWPVFRRMISGIVVGVIVGAVLAKFLHSHVLEIIFGVMIVSIGILMLVGFKSVPQRQLPGRLGIFSMSSLIGLQSGLLGVGGGSISIPFLTYCNVPLRDALGVSIAIGLTAAMIGTVSFMIAGSHTPNLPHWSTGYIYWPAVLGIAIVSPFFAMWGTTLSHKLPVAALRRVFAVFLLLVGIRMLF